MEEKQLHPYLAVMRPIMRGIAKMFAPLCEVVLHDLNHPESSVVAVENNVVTNRKEGQAMAPHILRIIRAPNFHEDMLVKYRSLGDENKPVKSTTMPIRDEKGELIGALCINFDLRPFLNQLQVLEEFTRIQNLLPPGDKVVSIKNADVTDILDHLVSTALDATRKKVSQLSRDEKIAAVEMMDRQGVFRIKGGMELVAKRLNVSRSILYEYISESKYSPDEENDK